ncbi:Eco29kI family restriction endonuclease [Streptomyces sp. DSM 42041]|uniref:Eco29kI family restriction endonuclease n=1 Tax=Streptomyces hazeniae TaxID=3075538 RepID=A0ABU2NKT2_9ACTN|nr:Eco29kI family restriction endonuclease [Streptomyces sp. DSM 42041]MDT0377211.1 Eco29kI family restriction endonuclease [Streptomyces sp. DSM 42041]
MPTSYTPDFFDPLSTDRLAHTICETFERQPMVSMVEDTPPFDGSGLYAIYYRGTTIAAYRPLADLQIPVYVGQALSSNSATGKAVTSKRPLRNRIRDHRRSIVGADLPINEFRFRALRLPDVHTNLGEDGLRVGYQPVWNSVLNGFGSHEQGQSTRKSKKSKWDTFHEGRDRTHGGDAHDPEQLAAEVAAKIDQQVTNYHSMPWPHPEQPLYLDLD